MELALDADYWDNRYTNETAKWDIGSASPAITDYFENIDRSSKILIPGCGNSYEGEILWLMGFRNIHLIDFALSTKDNFIKRVPTFPIKQFHIGDFFKFEQENNFDYIIEQTFYCALNPELRDAYLIKMKQLMAQYGKLVGLLFDAPLNTDHPPFGGNKEQYVARFSTQFKSVEMNPCNNSVEARKGRELFIEVS
ncbi:MAG: hypothetical protein ACI9N1_002594 [Flavobacteriales bacterium]|jgi:hypothetical protein